MRRALLSLPASPLALKYYGFSPVVILVVGALIVALGLTILLPIAMNEARREWRKFLRDEDDP